MFNTFAKSLWRCQPFKRTKNILALQNYATFTVKDLLFETSDEAGTLITRFAKHVALERQRICEQVPNEVRYSDYFPVTDVRYFQKELEKTDREQLAAVIIFAFTYRSNADPNKFAIILNELDRYAVTNVKEMSADTILRTLYAFLFLMPNWMTRLDFYGRAMERLYEDFSKQEVKQKEFFVQLCFYMGLNKKIMKYNVNSIFSSFLSAHLDKHISDMSTLDMAVVSNAAYKTSTVISSENFNKRLLKEVLDISNILDGNDALLVNFIKSMRLQRLRSSKVCEYIENICQDEGKLKQLQPRGQVHLFAYLAECLWDSKVCTQSLIETITRQLTLARKSNDCYSQILKGKDISTFLWSCAQLNCSLSAIQFRTIENSILEKLNAGEYNYFADQLVSSCLSLWILGYKSKELLQAAVQIKAESSNQRKQPKVDSRLSVLLSAAKIEEPEWCSTVIKGFEAFDPKAKLPQHILKEQDIPYREVLDAVLKEGTVSSANLSCPINGINIPGIYIKYSSANDSQVFLELINATQTLHFSKDAVAIFRLKLRLLQALGHKVKLLDISDALNPEILKNAIKECNTLEEHIQKPAKSSING